MARFKTLRQRRYEDLRNAGFLEFEARPLSKIKRNVPYLKDITRDRQKLLKRAERKNWTAGQFSASIKAKYRGKNWLTKDAKGRTKLDPHKLVKATERQFKDDHPDYVSPWRKRKQKFNTFVSKFEQRQPRRGQRLSEAEKIARKRGRE
ncbi:hypothetical protein LCGC14_0686610 [marine sediment metagenome]|uniref:Uncharacterized protein n=1 Tax=marine sediment metagenome TaxID=412755 RepID=A0A0F9QRH5_9ZZZZ